MRRLWLRGTVIVLGLLGSPPILADPLRQALDTCAERSSTLPEATIAACNDAIATSDRLTRDGLATVYGQRGDAWARKGEYEKALWDYGNAMRLDPLRASFYVSRSVVWRRLKETTKAFTDLDEAIRLDPGLAQPFNNRGNLWVELGVYDRAIADFDRALALNPNYANALRGRGLAYLRQGDFQRAVADFGEAMDRGLSPGAILLDRGIARMLQRDFAAAVADFERAMSASADPSLLRHIGVSQYLLGDFERSALSLRRAVAAPNDDLHAALWVYLASARSLGVAHARSELAVVASRTSERRWPRPLVEHFLGHISATELIAAAGGPEPWTTLIQICEAALLVAHRLSVDGDARAALGFFDAARVACAKWSYNSTSAAMELERLSRLQGTLESATRSRPFRP